MNDWSDDLRINLMNDRFRQDKGTQMLQSIGFQGYYAIAHASYKRLTKSHCLKFIPDRLPKSLKDSGQGLSHVA
jgi:hypothetical protein